MLTYRGGGEELEEYEGEEVEVRKEIGACAQQTGEIKEETLSQCE
jgi:hypothetical protein